MAQRSLVGSTITVGCGFLALLGLGTWQLQRLQWKEGLIAARHAALDAAPVPPPDSLDDARQLAFHPVIATGSFLNDKEVQVYAASADGAPGYHVVTPLRLSTGALLFIDRGFVPEDRRAPETRAAGELSGPVTVTGLLRLPADGRPGWFTPDNLPGRNQWYTIDVAAMASAAGLADVLPYHLDADTTPNPGGLPEGGQTVLDLPNNHLQYAITWYALAAVLLAIYILALRRRAGEKS